MGVPAVDEACLIKQTRRKRADMAAIKSAIYEAVKADPPMTVRQVFYQLVVRRVIDKTEAEYQSTVIRLLTEMRLEGELSFSGSLMKAAGDVSRKPSTMS